MLLRQISEDEYEKIGRVFISASGKEVLGILSKVFYNTVSFTPGQADVSAFKEGQRDLVQVLRAAADAVERKIKQENEDE